MVNPAALNAEAPRATRQSQGRVAPGEIGELLSLANRGLAPMFDAAADLFCHRLVDTGSGLRREGISQRYTAMTLLGLHELAAAGGEPVVDIQRCYQALVRDTGWIQGVGDLGLLIWVTAELAPERTADLLRIFDFEKALARYEDSRQLRTMELAWFLTGLVSAWKVSPQHADALKDLSFAAYQRLKKNQGPSGLFGHMGTAESVAGRFRGHIGSFADQVYPVYAMSKFARMFHEEQALDSALRCASTVCQLQGEMGQWWWLYDARKGRVSSYYPVYSVHQHGMAPMALFAAEEVSGRNYADSIYRGLNWIFGANERGIDMRDDEGALIWRCLRPRAKHSKYWQIASNAMQRGSSAKPARNLTVLREQRPYEFGWLLFAFAPQAYISSHPGASAPSE